VKTTYTASKRKTPPHQGERGRKGIDMPKPSMTVESESENSVLKLWFLLHQVRDVIMNCEDQLFSEHDLTSERYLVLALTKLSDGPVRPTDLARWLGRSPNSVSMLVDRMVKAGLIRRVRTSSDRRVVRLTTAGKRENGLEPATTASLELIEKILSPLSDEDKHAFVRLLETTKHQALQCLNHGADVQKVEESDITNYPDLMNRLFHYVSTPTPEAKRRGVNKAKTM
jgi:DNA-binding MarR family transcriptional regulator